jgi:hypothetical protein
MSNRSGHALGVLFVLIGGAACGAGYKMQSVAVFLAGLVVFGVAAYLLDSTSMKAAVTGLRDDAGDLIPLGRRSTDGVAKKVEPEG